MYRRGQSTALVVLMDAIYGIQFDPVITFFFVSKRTNQRRQVTPLASVSDAL